MLNASTEEWIKGRLQGQEDEYFGPYTSTMLMGVNTESLECGEDNKDSGPTVIKREGEMYK